jgi:hypothetical protein
VLQAKSKKYENHQRKLFYTERGAKDLVSLKDKRNNFVNFWVPIKKTNGQFYGVIGI